MRLGNAVSADRSLPLILEIIQINGNIGTKRKRFRVRLFHDGGPYHKIQCIDLQSKSMDWSLYDRDHHHERVEVFYDSWNL